MIRDIIYISHKPFSDINVGPDIFQCLLPLRRMQQEMVSRFTTGKYPEPLGEEGLLEQEAGHGVYIPLQKSCFLLQHI